VISPRLVPKTICKDTPGATRSSNNSPATQGAGDAAGNFRALFTYKAPQAQATAPPNSTTTTPSTTAGTGDAAADFRALFSVKPAAPSAPQPAGAPAPATQSVPTLESVFGPNPFMANPGFIGPDGKTYGYNPVYFATRETAEKLAQMYGGTVVERNYMAPNGGFQQTQVNEMIQFPNGNVVNAGLLASYFNLGLTKAQIDQTVATDMNYIPT